jgi:uncharacterized membrane protein YfcA
MTISLLMLASFIAWFISSLAGGGSPFIIIPMVNFLLEPQAVPPVVTTGCYLVTSRELGNFGRTLIGS